MLRLTWLIYTGYVAVSRPRDVVVFSSVHAVHAVDLRWDVHVALNGNVAHESNR